MKDINDCNSGMDLVFAEDNSPSGKLAYEVSKFKMWLEKHYYYDLCTNMGFTHYLDFGPDTTGFEIEDITRNAIEELKVIFESYLQENINKGNSIGTIRVKFTDISDFVPMIFENMGDGILSFQHDLSESICNWMDYIQKYVKPKPLPILEIMMRKSERLLKMQQRNQQPNSTYKPSTIRRKIQSVRLFCKFLNEKYGFHYGDDKSFPDVIKPTDNHSQKRTITTRDIEIIVNSIYTNKKRIGTFVGYRDKAIIMALSNIGLTVLELINLKVSDIDWDNRIITIGRGTVRERRQVIDSQTRLALRNYFNHGRWWDLVVYLDRENKRFGFDGTEFSFAFPELEDFFITANGKRISRISVFKIVKKRAEKAGFYGVNPQMLRESLKARMKMQKKKTEIPKKLGIKRVYNRDL